MSAADGLPEIDVHDIFQVAALLRLRLRRATASTEKLGEDIAESAAGFRAPAAARTSSRATPGTARKEIRKIEPAEVHARMR